jgi:type II secretory pathway pseudopilin PulG
VEPYSYMRTPLTARRHRISLHAFSLVEMVFAIAVLSVSLVVIIGLLAEGLSNNHDSSGRLQAADIASLLITTRRTAPTNSNLTNFALPALGGTNSAGQDVVNATTNYVKVQTDGTISSGTPASTQVVYNLRYIITPSGSKNNIANVDLVLWWPSTLPASASSMPVNNPAGYYELITQVALP